MVVEFAIVAALGYVGYREYKSGKLASEVKALEAKVNPLVAKAEADAKTVVSTVAADVKKAL